MELLFQEALPPPSSFIPAQCFNLTITNNKTSHYKGHPPKKAQEISVGWPEGVLQDADGI